VRDDAAAAYAWCRRADDAIDERPPAERPAALARLRAEVDDAYAGRPLADPTAAAFAEVVRRRAVPRRYPEELLAGMEMDVAGRRYATLDELLLYCWRVAGVVGLIMCHVMGLRRAAALRQAAHLGIAMQLTNICRDVAEDWRDGRLYVPGELLGVDLAPGGALPPSAAFAPAIAALLAEARRYYRSGEGGLSALSFRCGLAVRTARHVYAAIGGRIAARRFDVRAGRAVVSTGRKLVLLGWSLVRALAAPALGRFRPAPLPALRFPDDVLPL
jgi:phytoene synthase